jgi:GTP-binding protein Era
MSDLSTHSFRAGFVTLVGLPNVGKSTLLNALVGERLSIITSKAQTTQRKLRAIYSSDKHQAIFIDTPGIMKPRYTLHRSMHEEAMSAIEDADVIVAVIDVGFAPSIEWGISFDLSREKPTLLCFNKSDLISKKNLVALHRRFSDAGWEAIYTTDASKEIGIESFRSGILERLPESAPLYPVDELSDVPVREFVAEMIRETCLEELAEEVPYSIAVQVDQFKERRKGKPTYIEAVIYVERESQKGIVVGTGGAMIRKIGTRTRVKIEQFLGQRVYLELRVKVLQNWRKKSHQLRVLGFRVPTQEK